MRPRLMGESSIRRVEGLYLRLSSMTFFFSVSNGKRPRTTSIGNAVHVMKILTGEIEETIPDDGKDQAAKALDKKGGAARAKSMTPERRAEIAKKAAASRICLRALNPHLIDDNRNSRRHLVCRWSKVSCAKVRN